MSTADEEQATKEAIIDSTSILVDGQVPEVAGVHQSTTSHKNLLGDSKLLCPRCDSLQLSPDHFVVQSLRKQENTSSRDFRLRSTTAPVAFGTLQAIGEGSKGGCKLCDLLSRSIRNKQGDKDDSLSTSPDVLSAACTLGWEVDGRKMFEDRYCSHRLIGRREVPRGLTRCIHVNWSNDKLQDLYLVFVASQYAIVRRMQRPKYLFLDRQIGAHGSIKARVKSWIDLCQQKHRGPCVTPHWGGMSQTHFRKMIASSCFGVIDVLNMQLTQLPCHIPREDLSASNIRATGARDPAIRCS